MKTKIEWCDYTINPVKGLCPMACDYCYARRMYKRFKWNPEIRYDGDNSPSPWDILYTIKNPARIFIGSTMELFGDHIKTKWLDMIFHIVGGWKQHTFIFLTKQPQNLPKQWSDNCWVGVSITGKEEDGFAYPLVHLQAKIKFLSIEPLLAPVVKTTEFGSSLKNAGINWIIIGQQTPAKKSTTPKIEWIRGIVEAADKASVPVFLKDNLKSVIATDAVPLSEVGKLRQEFPR